MSSAILIVDDNPFNRQLLRHILCDHYDKLDEAADVKNACVK